MKIHSTYIFPSVTETLSVSSHPSDYLQCNQSIVCLFIEFGSLFVYLISVCKMELSGPRIVAIDRTKCQMPDCLHNCVLNACVSLRATNCTVEKQRRTRWKNNPSQCSSSSSTYRCRYRQWARIILSVSRPRTTITDNREFQCEMFA